MAAKVLKSNDAIQAADFRRECATLERLRHLHVVQFYAHIEGDDGIVEIYNFHEGQKPMLCICSHLEGGLAFHWNSC